MIKNSPRRSWPLICLQKETKADAEPDLRDAISGASVEGPEKARRKRRLRHMESADKAPPAGISKVQLEKAGMDSSESETKQ